MFKTYATNVFINSINSGFNSLHEFDDQVISNDKSNILLYRVFGPNLYIYTLFNIDVISKKDLISDINVLRSMVEALPMAGRFKNIYVVNSLCYKTLNEDKLDEFKDFSKLTSLNSQNLKYIFWIVNRSDDFSIQFGENQPTKALGFETILEESVNSHFDVVPSNMRGLKEYARTINKVKPMANSIVGTMSLIVAMLVVYIVTAFNANYTTDFMLMHDTLSTKQYYRLVSSLFVHANAIHFLSNVFGLYLFGARLERYMGYAQLMLIFFISGIVGNIATLMFTNFDSLGASGAIFGIMGAFLIFLKDKKVEIYGISYEVTLTFIIASIGFGVLTPSINNVAHMSGLVVGLLLGYAYSLMDKN